MKNKRRHTGYSRRFLLGLFICLAGGLFAPLATVAAQETSSESKTFDRPYWRKTIEGLDYSSHPDATPPRTEMRQRQTAGEEEPGAAANQESNWDLSIPGLELIGKIILILAAALILFLLLRGLLGIQWAPRNKRVQKTGDPEADLEKIEADIEAFDLDDYIRKALDRGAHALAIRLLYLAALKALSSKQLIYWKKNKTNRDYLWEMQDTRFQEDFQRLTRAFEQIWYGDPPFTAADFQVLEPQFRRFINSVEERRTSLSNDV